MLAKYVHPLYHQASRSLRVRCARLRMGKRRLQRQQRQQRQQQQQQRGCLCRHERAHRAGWQRRMGSKQQDRRPRCRPEQCSSSSPVETSGTGAVPVAGFRGRRGRRRHSEVVEPQRGGVSAGACGSGWIGLGRGRVGRSELGVVEHNHEVSWPQKSVTQGEDPSA